MATSIRGSTVKVFDAANNARRSTARPRASTINTLHLANLHLHGRDEDLKLLKTKLRDLVVTGGKKDDETTAVPNKNNKKYPEFIVVAGLSGTGKSALIKRGLRDPAEKSGIIFASGKFDRNTSATLPLSALVDAMSALADCILKKKGDVTVEQIRNGIRDTLGEEEAGLLIRALPGCGELFFGDGDSISHASHSHMPEQLGKASVKRMHCAFCKLMKVICTHVKGVVLFIDDLQWSDASTLDLLNSVSLDAEIPSLLVAGAYRKDEVSDSHPLALQLKEKKQNGLPLTEINIENLSSNSVKYLVAEALGMEGDEDAVETLAATVHKKTEGNPFFVLVFLASLHGDGLLTYNFGVMQWKWDDDKVKAKLATQNVATVLVNKLKHLKESSQNILKIASCIGARFNASIVAVVAESLSPIQMRRLSSVVSEADDICDCDDTVVSEDSLQELAEEGLWEKEIDNIWHFGHDQLQSAAFELIPPEKRDAFRGEIGHILMARLDPDVLEECLFEVVSLCNYSTETRNSKSNRLAQMNVQAGMKASENAVFDTAALYFKAGRELMGNTGWETDRDTILKLCSEGANACFIIGDLGTMHAMIDEVLSQDLPVEDKVRVFEIKVLAALAANKFNEAIDTAIEVRRQLGLSTPKNKQAPTITVLKEYIKTSKLLKKMTAEDIASLPKLSDQKYVMGQKMLQYLLTATFLAQPTMYPLVSFLLVRTSIKHGINSSSCEAFASFGLLQCGAFGKQKAGREMGRAVELLLEKPGMKSIYSKSLFFLQTVIYPWTCPLQNTLRPLLEGYQSGIEVGDTESAGWNLVTRSTHLYCVGRSLEGLQDELEATAEVLQQFNQIGQRMIMLNILLIVKKLRGIDDKEVDLQFAEVSSFYSATDNVMVRAHMYVAKLDLACRFQQWEDAAELLQEAGDLHPACAGLFIDVMYTFVQGLICLKAAQKEKTWSARRKLKKQGQKSIRLLRGWAKVGNVNVVHKIFILTAELAALESNRKKAEENYKSAISCAAKHGFAQDKALAHALASVWFAGSGEDYWAQYHKDSAEQGYLEWGVAPRPGMVISE